MRKDSNSTSLTLIVTKASSIIHKECYRKRHTSFWEESSMAMSSIARKEYVDEVRKQYQGASKATKRELLNVAVVFTGLHRKSLIRQLRAPLHRATTRQPAKLRGPKCIYDSAFHDALLVCWQAENNICAERLQPFLPELVPKLEACGELRISADTRRLLSAASISTVARHLEKAQRRSHVSLGTTKPGSLLKSQIAVRRGRWEETNPGWLESDTVAHGGDSAAGQFIFTYDFLDIATGWTELEASMGKGERATVAGFTNVRERFPFPVLGIDSDNGSEYINDHLKRYCKREDLTFTRSRPYHKNDNAHVEQKNWEAVRKMVGYSRLDTEEQLQILHELYRGPLRLYLNFFQPTRKRKAKLIDTTTGQKRKSYFEAKTPYQRVQAHPATSQATKDLLTSQYNQLNPVKLLAEVRSLLDRLNSTLR
jgi:hypothetical protein